MRAGISYSGFSHIDSCIYKFKMQNINTFKHAKNIESKLNKGDCSYSLTSCFEV